MRMMSAPQSARWRTAVGPARARVRSITVMPESGSCVCCAVLGSVWSMIFSPSWGSRRVSRTAAPGEGWSAMRTPGTLLFARHDAQQERRVYECLFAPRSVRPVVPQLVELGHRHETPGGQRIAEVRHEPSPPGPPAMAGPRHAARAAHVLDCEPGPREPLRKSGADARVAAVGAVVIGPRAGVGVEPAAGRRAGRARKREVLHRGERATGLETGMDRRERAIE